MSKPPPLAPTASAIGPCPTVIKFVGRPGTGRLPSTIAPPDHPLRHERAGCNVVGSKMSTRLVLLDFLNFSGFCSMHRLTCVCLHVPSLS